MGQLAQMVSLWEIPEVHGAAGPDGEPLGIADSPRGADPHEPTVIQRNRRLSEQSRQRARLFLQSSALGLTLSPLSPSGECVPAPFDSGGGGHTRVRERELGGSNSDEGIDTVGLQVFMYFVVKREEGYMEIRICG